MDEQGTEHRIGRLFVVANPASGKDEPVLGVLDRVLRPTGIAWDLSITKGPGDAAGLAREAVKAGFDAVAAYGGDGTVAEAAEGLLGTGVPLVILPGGTANAMAAELGVPADLESAVRLAVESHAVRAVDMGESDGTVFLLRVGVGFEARFVERATREEKERLGSLAYMAAALRELKSPPVARYTVTVDGVTDEADGITCIIANSGTLGGWVGRRTLSPDIDPSDGLLDVVVVCQADIPTLLSVTAAVVTGERPPEEPLKRWKGANVRVVAEPAQPVVRDGESQGTTPVEACVRPGALRVVVPLAEKDGRAQPQAQARA